MTISSYSAFSSRGFQTHYGPWSTGGDHQTHITAADLRAPYTTLGYDFHDQVIFYGFRDPAFDSRTPRPWEQLDTTPPTCLSSGCQISCRSTSGLREDSSSVVSPRAGLRHHHHRNLCQMTSLRQELEKKPEKPFMMYVAFDDLQVSTSSCQKCKISSATFFENQNQSLNCFNFRDRCKWKKNGGISILIRWC